MVNLITLVRRAFAFVKKAATRGAAAIINTPTSIWGGTTPEAAYALQSSAVWACCALISKSIAALPAHIYESTPTGKVAALDHPYYSMLTSQPNPSMTSSQYLQTTLMHLLLWGNAFTFLDRIGGEVIGMWPLLPGRVRIMYIGDNMVQYAYFDREGKVHYYQPGGDLIHFRLFTMDGIIGLSVLQYHRLTLDFQEASAAYALNLYRNGGRPGGVLEYPNTLKEDQIKKIRESWGMIHGGAQNAGRIAVLENGAKYNPIDVSPDDLQYIANQQFSVEQIARIFGVAPHLIGAQDKPTYASVEQQGIEFLRYTISPYINTLETSITAGLLEKPFSWRLNINGFERSDLKSRYSAYATARMWGWMSVNDVRELEDMNEIGDQGDIYLQPLNMVPAGTPPAVPITGDPATADPNEADVTTGPIGA